MNLERDKFLTEAMGECWHEMKQYIYFSECIKCNMTDDKIEMYAENNFSTWEGFGKLWEWATKQKWWVGFMGSPVQVQRGLLDIVHPDRFADAIYSYLKEDTK